MVSCGDADAMVTGNTRRYSSSLEKICKVVDPRPGEIMFGLNMIVNKGKTIFICDTTVIEYPDEKQLAEMAISAARVVRLFGFDPKVAFLSHSTFGQPTTDRTKRTSDAVKILKDKKVDFKFDGEMQPDVALEEMFQELYPFSEIVGNANVLIMPSQHSAAISYKMIQSMSRAKLIGPLLIGLGQATELWQIFMCYALMGFAYPAIGAAGISATLAPHFSKNFGLALGIALTGASLGGALIPFCTIFFIGAVGFKTTTLVLGLSVLVVLFCLSILFKYKAPDSVSCLLYTSPSPRDRQKSRIPSSA